MKVLEVKNLSIGYGNLILQKEVNFSLSEGEILFIKGANGSGKSTLIKTIIGEVRSLAGAVELVKSNIHICHLPQVVSYDLPIAITLGEMLKSFDVVEDSSIKFIDNNFLLKKWNEASGGEKQKALILSRVASGCDVLILDEPFNHIDQESIGSISLFLAELIRGKKVKSIIIVSHVSAQFDDKQPVKELSLK